MYKLNHQNISVMSLFDDWLLEDNSDYRALNVSDRAQMSNDMFFGFENRLANKLYEQRAKADDVTNLYYDFSLWADYNYYNNTVKYDTSQLSDYMDFDTFVRTEWCSIDRVREHYIHLDINKMPELYYDADVCDKEVDSDDVEDLTVSRIDDNKRKAKRKRPKGRK